MKEKRDTIYISMMSKDTEIARMEELLTCVDELIAMLEACVPETLGDQLPFSVPHFPLEMSNKTNGLRIPEEWAKRKAFIRENAYAFGFSDFYSVRKGQRFQLIDIDFYVKVKEGYNPHMNRNGTYCGLNIAKWIYEKLDKVQMCAWINEVCRVINAEYAYIYDGGMSARGSLSAPIFSFTKQDRKEFLQMNYIPVSGCFWGQLLTDDIVEKLDKTLLMDYKDILYLEAYETPQGKNTWLRLKAELGEDDREDLVYVRNVLQGFLPEVDLAKYAFSMKWNQMYGLWSYPLTEEEKAAVSAYTKLPKEELYKLCFE